MIGLFEISHFYPILVEVFILVVGHKILFKDKTNFKIENSNAHKNKVVVAVN